jgi:hypothetical protein
MATSLPSIIHSRLVDKICTVLRTHAIYNPTSKNDLTYASKVLIEAIEYPMRECFSREITAWHDYECIKTGIDCTCKELASIVAGKVLGDEIEI